MLFSGCAFGNAAKKTEMNLENKPSMQSQNTNVPAPEQDSQVSNPSTNNGNQGTGKNTDASTVLLTPAAPSQDSATKTTDISSSAAESSIPKFKIIDRLVGWGFTKSNNRSIDTIIIHSSYNAIGSDTHDLDDIINKEYKPNGVSPHYIIDRDGRVYRLVADQNIAYHAGVSKMPDGRTNVNDFSIGIEVVETQSESPSAAQYASLKSLIGYLKGEYKIKYVLGHSDIAPGRKDDPWNFSWGRIK